MRRRHGGRGRAFLAATSLTLGIAIVAGCGGRGRGDPETESAALAILSGLRTLDGGLDAWRSHGAVRFSCTIERGEGAGFADPFEIRELVFPLDSTGPTRVTRKDSGARWIPMEGLREWFLAETLDAAGGGHAEGTREGLEPNATDTETPRVTERAPLAEAALDRELASWALVMLRVLFVPSLATTTGAWEFQAVLAPRGIEAPPCVLATTILEGGRLGPVRLCASGEAKAVEGLLATLSLRGIEAEDIEVQLDDPEWVGGIRVPRERRFVLPSPPQDPPAPDPFGRTVPTPPVRPLASARIRIASIEFLSREDFERLAPDFGGPKSAASKPDEDLEAKP